MTAGSWPGARRRRIVWISAAASEIRLPEGDATVT